MTADHGTSRVRYTETLQAVALVWLIASHAYSLAWLPLVFPALPVLFALGGAAVGPVLDRCRVNPWPALARLAWRVFPPVWALAAVVVPVMVAVGWTADPTTGLGSPLAWDTMLLWLLPAAEPPGSEWGHGLSEPLWYIATYLWLLLLSPSLLWLFRRWPLRTMAVPLLILVGATAGLWSMEERAGRVVLSIATFAGCWMIGFAHHDNRIRQLSLVGVIPASLALMASGVLLWTQNVDPASGPDIEHAPLSMALWGMGAVLLLLRLGPAAARAPQIAWLAGAVAVVNARAVTIYLWAHPAVYLSSSLVDRLPPALRVEDSPMLGAVQLHAITLALIAAAVLVLGPLEDVGARHRVKRDPLHRNVVKESPSVGSMQPRGHRPERGTPP